MPSSRKHDKQSLGNLMRYLIRALHKQATAIDRQATAMDRLAASNEELVDLLMIERDGQPEGDEGDGLDMSGKPLNS